MNYMIEDAQLFDKFIEDGDPKLWASDVVVIIFVLHSRGSTKCRQFEPGLAHFCYLNFWCSELTADHLGNLTLSHGDDAR